MGMKSVTSWHRNAIELAAKDSYEKEKARYKSQFVVNIPEKNRFGDTNNPVVFEHTNSGVRIAAA